MGAKASAAAKVGSSSKRTRTDGVKTRVDHGAGRPAAWADVLLRSFVIGVLAVVLTSLFYASRPQWVPDMRLWRAVGDASLVLLVVTLALGPAGRLSAAAAGLSSWRRQLGIWTALTGLVHTVLVLYGWVAFDLGRLMGFEFVPELGRTARMEPGFGLANLMGLVAMALLLVLLATSSDAAVRRLGPPVWNWVQGFAHVVFYLVVLHTAYFLFLHYTLSFHRDVPEPNWFRFPVLGLAGALLALQAASSVSGARARRARPVLTHSR